MPRKPVADRSGIDSKSVVKNSEPAPSSSSRYAPSTSSRYALVRRALFSVRKTYQIDLSNRTISSAFRDAGIQVQRPFLSSRYAVEPGSIGFGFMSTKISGSKSKTWIPPQAHTGKTSRSGQTIVKRCQTVGERLLRPKNVPCLHGMQSSLVFPVCTRAGIHSPQPPLYAVVKRGPFSVRKTVPS